MDHPLLSMIDEANPHIRIYAYNGLALSFASEIENTMFWCLVGSSGMTVEAATPYFYKGRGGFAKMREKTDTAVTNKLQGAAPLTIWCDLNKRLQTTLGQGHNDRNLVGHNPVEMSVYVSVPLTEGGGERSTIIVSEVRQSTRMVDHLERQHRTVRDSDMRAYCVTLIELYLDLERFAEDALGFGHSHPLRCVNG